MCLWTSNPNLYLTVCSHSNKYSILGFEVIPILQNGKCNHLCVYKLGVRLWLAWLSISMFHNVSHFRFLFTCQQCCSTKSNPCNYRAIWACNYWLCCVCQSDAAIVLMKYRKHEHITQFGFPVFVILFTSYLILKIPKMTHKKPSGHIQSVEASHVLLVSLLSNAGLLVSLEQSSSQCWTVWLSRVF